VKKRLGLILAFLFPLALLAQSGAPTWQGDGLCRFILNRYPLTAENEGKINFIIGDLLQRHETAFGFTPDPDFHIHIRIFGRFQDYQQFAITNHSGFENEVASLTNLAGYYSGRNQEVVTWRQHDPTYLANNILHECSHAIMHHEFRALPIWLDEGCAVYFQFPAFMRSASAVQRLNGQWYEMKHWQDEGSLPKLRQFLNLSPPEFRAMDPARAYTVSWSIFQLLMCTPENRQAMNTMIREYQRPGATPPDCAALLDKAYPGGLAKMETDWQFWIKQGAMNVLGPTR
jgi:hypothetical protein